MRNRARKIKGIQKVKELKGRVKKIRRQVSVGGRGGISCAVP